MVARLSLSLVLAASAFPQGLEYVRAHYTKSEYRIPMRDGKRLFAAVYTPKDQSQSYPILLNRTPYSVGPYGADRHRENLGPNERLAKSGYIFVYQDVRGKYMSEGEFVNMRPHLEKKSGPAAIDESTDTYDTIDWLVKNIPNNNGRAGLWGISYPGFYAAAGMIDAHPALKASSPQAPIMDWFTGDDFHRNGVFYLTHAFRFFSGFGKPRPEPTTKSAEAYDFQTPDGYRFYLELGPLANFNEKIFKNEVKFWNEMLSHETYDSFWKERNLRPHLKGIKPAVMVVGGWFDAENLYGALQAYQNVERQSPGAQNVLVMGPWFHGGWNRSPGNSLGDVRFDVKTSDYYQEKIETPFFEAHLKQKDNPPAGEAIVFETGANQWRTFDQWPPRSAAAQTLFLRENGGLSFDPPQVSEGRDQFISDPAKPVPYIADIATGMTREHMVADQRHASTRPDVLVYQTPELEEDVTLAGPLQAKLIVSTTGTDADWVVKLIDVYPDSYPDPSPNPTNVRMGAYQMLVRGEIFRGKFRNGFDKPEPFVPGQATKVEYELNDVCHTFRRGHRIMIQIHSTWFPLADRNPQKFLTIPEARAADFQAATHSVHRSASQPTGVVVRVLPRLTGLKR